MVAAISNYTQRNCNHYRNDTYQLMHVRNIQAQLLYDRDEMLQIWLQTKESGINRQKVTKFISKVC